MNTRNASPKPWQTKEPPAAHSTATAATHDVPPRFTLRGALPLVGLSFWQAWWMISSTTSVVSSAQPHGLGSISAVMLATLLGYAVLTVCASRFAPYGCPRSFMLAGFGGLIGSLLLSMASHLTLPTLPATAVSIIGLAVFSPANALLLLMWGERWGTLAAGNVGRQLVLSFTFAFILYFLVVVVPVPMAIVINAAFPPYPHSHCTSARINPAAPNRSPPSPQKHQKWQPFLQVSCCYRSHSDAWNTSCPFHKAGNTSKPSLWRQLGFS